jgi:hypothetical protein
MVTVPLASQPRTIPIPLLPQEHTIGAALVSARSHHLQIVWPARLSRPSQYTYAATTMCFDLQTILGSSQSALGTVCLSSPACIRARPRPRARRPRAPLQLAAPWSLPPHPVRSAAAAPGLLRPGAPPASTRRQTGCSHTKTDRLQPRLPVRCVPEHLLQAREDRQAAVTGRQTDSSRHALSIACLDADTSK